LKILVKRGKQFFKKEMLMKNLIYSSLLLVNFAFAQSSTTESAASVSTTLAAPRSFQFTYKNETSSLLDRNYKTGGGATTDNQFKATYLLGEDVRFGLFASAKTDIAGLNETQSSKEWISGDLAAVVESVYAGFLGSDKTLFEGRMYFPTSETSKDAKQDLQLRADLNLPYTLGSVLSSNIYFSPRYASLQGDNDQFKTVTQAKVAAKANSVLTAYAALNHINNIKQTNVFKRAVETLGPEVGADITVNPIVKFNLSLLQDRAIYQPTNRKVRPDFALFDTKETQYMLKAQIKY
jgi:hypothetical protein